MQVELHQIAGTQMPMMPPYDRAQCFRLVWRQVDIAHCRQRHLVDFVPGRHILSESTIVLHSLQFDGCLLSLRLPPEGELVSCLSERRKPCREAEALPSVRVKR